MGGKSGGSSTQTSMQEIRPPSEVQPYLSGALNNFQQLYNRPQEVYGGHRYAAPVAENEEGLHMLRTQAHGAQDFLQPSMNLFQDTIGGKYLDQDYLMQQAQPGINAALSGINAQTMGGGGRGSSLAAQAAGRAGAEAMLGQYGLERGRQQQALGMLPQMNQQRYAAGNVLQNVGEQRRQYVQGGINEQMARFNDQQNLPWQRAGQYAGLLGSVAPLMGQNVYGETEQDSGGGGGLLGSLGSLAGMAMGGPLGGSLGGMLGGSLGGGGITDIFGGGPGLGMTAPMGTGGFNLFG